MRFLPPYLLGVINSFTFFFFFYCRYRKPSYLSQVLLWMVHGKQWSKQGVKSLDTYFQIRYFYIWMFTPGLPVFLLEFASYTPITTWSRISLILLLHQFLIFQSLIITFTPNANQCFFFFFFFFLVYNKQSVFLIKRPTCSAHREPHDCQCFPSVSYIQNGNKAIQYVTY